MPENKPSIRVLEKLGFTSEGVRREPLHCSSAASPAGARHDHLAFSLLDSDYAELAAERVAALPAAEAA